MTQNSDDIDRYDDGGALLRQAHFCREMGSPFTADVLAAARRTLHRAPLTATKIAQWPGDRGQAAVALRLTGGLHALARSGDLPTMTALYREMAGDFDAVIGAALEQADAFLCGWIDSPPKTNEVTRAGAIMAALLMVSERFGLPMELLELGSSAGLNLNMHRYAYDLAGVKAGDPASPVRIAPDWRGPPPPQAYVDILATAGVDIEPLDLTDPATAGRLMAYVWADRTDRMERLEHAIALARSHPPDLVPGDAAQWIERRLDEPQQAGRARVVFHSIVLQYIPADARVRIATLLAEAGARADKERPLAHISFEWDQERSVVQLVLTSWPGGTPTELATCHAHAEWIDWRG